MTNKSRTLIFPGRVSASDIALIKAVLEKYFNTGIQTKSKFLGDMVQLVALNFEKKYPDIERMEEEKASTSLKIDGFIEDKNIKLEKIVDTFGHFEMENVKNTKVIDELLETHRKKGKKKNK